MSRVRAERNARPSGLSDRDSPSQLSVLESPDLRNVEFFRNVYGKRLGWKRVHETYGYLRDSSVRIDGINDYWRAPLSSNLDIGPPHALFFAIIASPHDLPVFNAGAPTASERTVFMKGFGTGANLVVRLYWNGALNAGLGGWSVQARDAAGAGTTKTWNVFDGDGLIPKGTTRYFEFGWFGATGYKLKVYDSPTHALIGESAPQTITTWSNAAQHLYVGVGQSAFDTPDSGTMHTTPDYLAATIAELRISAFDMAAQPTGSVIAESNVLAAGRESVTARELGGPLEVNPFHLKGYWKFNDGMGITARDTSGMPTPADMLATSTGPIWETDQTKVISSAGIRMNGKDGFVHVQFSQADVNELFNPATYSKSWTFSIMWVPEMEAGEVVVRNQTLFWFGTNTATPAPLGLRVISDRLQVKWNAFGGLQTFLHGPPLSTIVNKRCRITFTMQGGATSDQLIAYIGIEGVPYAGSHISFATTPAGAVPTPSPHLILGRTLTNTNFPYAYGSGAGETPLFGVLDDVYIIQAKSTVPQAPYAPGFSSATFNQAEMFAELGVMPGNNVVQLYLKMNEGAGSTITVEGAWASTSAYLYPMIGEGVYWNSGLVEPYTWPEGRLIHDYRRFSAGKQAEPVRTVLIVTGTTLSEVNLDTGAVKILSGGIDRPGLCTSAQYGSKVYIGSRNGKRPLRFDGQQVGLTGLDSAVSAVSGVTTAAGVGTFAAGNYYIYQTFYGSGGQVESNPGPPQLVTLLANDRITGFSLPTSPDPQVQGRYVYMTPVAGQPGSAAYLIADIKDNTRIAITGLVINNVSTGAAQLEYFDNGPAPAGGVVAIFGNRLFVGGSQEFPTYVFFSGVTTFEGFDQEDDYVDLDNDTGDPVISLFPRLDVLTAFCRDSRWDLWLTGIDIDPVDARRTSSSIGCVSPQSVAEYARQQVFVGERNIFMSNGYDDRSLSSPPRSDRPNTPSPSIQTTLREKIQTAAWEKISICPHRSKDKMLFAVPLKDTVVGKAKRNSDILDYDFTGSRWSRYDIEADVLQEIEDGSDAPWPYAIIHGFLCKLDTVSSDGDQEVVGETIQSVSGGTALTFASTPFLGKNLKGVPIWFWTTDDAARIGRSTVVRHSDSTLELDSPPGKLDGSIYNLLAGDNVAVGPIQWWFDLIIAAPLQTRLKRGLWLTFAIREQFNSSRQIVLFIAPGDLAREPSWNTRITNPKVFPFPMNLDLRMRFPLTGQASAYRIRVGDGFEYTGIPTNAKVHFEPPIPRHKSFEIVEIVSEFIETDAR